MADGNLKPSPPLSVEAGGLVSFLSEFLGEMYSRVPSLVGLDLWHAIDGEQEDKGLHSRTAKRTSLRPFGDNRCTVPFKESQINDGNSTRFPSESFVAENYHEIMRYNSRRNLNNLYQNDYTTNTLSNDLIKEVLNDNNPTIDSTSHHHKQNWFDWNFPSRGLVDNGPREELRNSSEIFSKNQTKTPTLTVNPCSCECKNGSPASVNKTKYMDSVRKDFHSSSKNTSQKVYKKDNCCRFCLKNGEVQVYYESHLLKDSAGNVVCPILSKYTCPRCGATGKKAHTIRHCPLNAQFSSILGNNYKVKRRNAAGHITTFRL